MIEDLPDDWAETLVDDVTLPVLKINQNGELEKEIRYIDISSIDNIRNKVTHAKIYKLADAPSRARQIIQSGDVLFATVRPYLRNIAAVPELYDGEIASTGFAVLRPALGIEPKYLFYYCTSAPFVDRLSGIQYGVSYPAVKDEQVRAQPFPLPPTNEQKRIVAKIDELFSELDKGIESLKTAHEQLKVYRQAILKHAFEGKLTARWREQNKNKLETADQLLERIKRERDAEYQSKLDEWEAALKGYQAECCGTTYCGKTLRPVQTALPGFADMQHSTTFGTSSISKPRKPKELRGFSEEDFSWLPDLPNEWVWERLGWITCGVEYGTAAKSSESGKVPVLRMGNIQNMKFDWSDLVYTSDTEEIAKYSLKEGDVLFNRTNSPELVGKTAIYKGERPAVFAGYLIRINQIERIVDSRYLNFYLNSYVAKQYGNRVKTDGVNQSNINGERLAHYPFPYCSCEEQKVIVSILEEQLSLVDQMEDDIALELQKSEALRQSILKKTFCGKLVAQDPNDEPASVLLERIRAEKEAQQTESKKPKAKRNAA